MHSLVSLYGNNFKTTLKEQLTTGKKGSGRSPFLLWEANLTFLLVFLTENGCLHAEIVALNKAEKNCWIEQGDLYSLFHLFFYPEEKVENSSICVFSKGTQTKNLNVTVKLKHLQIILSIHCYRNNIYQQFATERTDISTDRWTCVNKYFQMYWLCHSPVPSF